MGCIFLSNPTAHEVGDGESTRSLKELMVLGDNHVLAEPFKVAEKALHITSSEYP